MFLKKRFGGAARAVLLVAVSVCLMAVFALSAGLAGKNTTEQGIAVAQDSIRRAAVQCYALEGVYPPSYEYLRDHYGININEELYFVGFQYVADNLMPDITVIVRGKSIDEVMS